MKIAIVKLSALGDIIHAMVALQFIKDFYPDIEIDWIVDEHFKEVLINNPHIRNIHTVLIKKAKKKKSLLLLLKELRKLQKLKKYDLVIDSQGLIKSAILAKMIPAKKITGFDSHSIRESFASIFYNQKISIAYNENTIDRNIAVFCKPLNISVSSEEIIDKRPFIFSKHQIRLIDEPYIVFVIGSTWESRNYPKEKFVEIAKSNLGVA